MSRSEEETARVTREITARAIRRLDMLEWAIFGGAAVLATIGGALIAFLLAGPLGVAFRPAWLVASVVLFVVPGAIAVTILRRDERRRARRLEQLREERDQDT
ncbi:MAG: DUF2269 family protein [Gemmatimonadota bacterium]|nr:DUF2269 family protein [Gemmatimonadota bacterium]